MRALFGAVSKKAIQPNRRLERLSSLPIQAADSSIFHSPHHNPFRFYCWIPVLSLLVFRPVATWSYLPYSVPNPARQVQQCPHPLLALRFKSPSFTVAMPRTTRSTTSTTSVMAKEETKEDETLAPSPRKRKSASKDSQASSKKNRASVSPADKKKPRAKKGETSSPKASRENDLPEVNDEEDSETKKKKSPATKQKKKSEAQRITDRDPLPKLWDSQAAAEKDGSYPFRIASWNVAGLRALMKKYPTALVDLCKEYNLDVLCLQETKLQEMHLDDPKLKLRGCLSEAGYDEYWSCSTVKKGYSGTAVFIKQRGSQKKAKQSDIESFFAKNSKAKGDEGKANSAAAEVANVPAELVTPTDVAYKIGKPIDNEGRTIIMDFPFATITNVYVPNSGQVLERLDYRTKEWDKDFLTFQQKKEKDRGLPVIWLGDLNIAHKAYDVWNDGAPHLSKQAGVTEQERASFQAMLDAGYVDAFRKLHPEARGHYSYWSQRAGNREPNKGLRLDYFVCSPELFSEDSKVVVRDSYMIPERLGSDHAPVVLDIELKNKL